MSEQLVVRYHPGPPHPWWVFTSRARLAAGPSVLGLPELTLAGRELVAQLRAIPGLKLVPGTGGITADGYGVYAYTVDEVLWPWALLRPGVVEEFRAVVGDGGLEVVDLPAEAGTGTPGEGSPGVGSAALLHTPAGDLAARVEMLEQQAEMLARQVGMLARQVAELYRACGCAPE